MAGNTVIEFPGEIALQCMSALSRVVLYNDEMFQKRVVNELARFIDSGGELVSFDVFDTVLIRNNKSELRRFLEIAERCSLSMNSLAKQSVEPAVLLVARLAATELSYRFSKPVRGCREGRLDEIHLGAARRLSLPDELAKNFVAEEIGYEMETLTLNPWFIKIVEMVLEAGLRIVFISDMYMRGTDIAELIDGKASADFGPSLVYSSGDLKISKKSGFLFDYVAERFGVAPSNAFHLGDNLDTDYRSAKSRGWNALYLPHTVTEREAIARDERLVATEIANMGVDIKLFTGR